MYGENQIMTNIYIYIYIIVEIKNYERLVILLKLIYLKIYERCSNNNWPFEWVACW